MTRTTRRQLSVLALGGLAVASVTLWTRSATADNAKPVRYSHAAHEKLKVDHADCKSCHTLNDQFDVLPSTMGKNHQPCSESGCHNKEFFAREPKICGVCHDSAEPWVKQKAYVRRRKTSEFGGDLSHKSHTQSVRGQGGKNGACKACHGDVFRGTKPGQSGHTTCSKCHAKTAEPSMGTCGSCHKLGATRATLAGGASAWSVAARFNHRTHGSDPRTRQTETACVDCHAEVAKATRLAELKNPRMQSCDGCHNGKHAFKTTGFECVSCHGDSAKTGDSAGGANKK